ncbi:MAG: tetratricopeptide repeat protein [Candidatus Acidiferrales bacterium]
MHDSSPTHATADLGADIPLLVQPDDSCLLWTEGKTDSATVSAANLKAPPAARDEYKKACSEVRAKHWPEAETHIRKAIDLDSEYPGAWALLGQVLEANQKILEAKSACAKASSADAAYAPAYLCLSDLAAQQNDWQASLDFADRSLALDPVQNAYGHFYSAVAQVHLGKVSQAESSALDAIDADHRHRVPQIHLLLAQIYGSQGNLSHAAEQLRAYLKVARNAPDAPTVRKSLAQLEAQLQK